MQIKKTEFDGLIEMFPDVFDDERGWFYEFYKTSTFKASGMDNQFVQDNLSFSKKGVIRGLHFQLPPYGQAKLVTVVSGRVLDVVVDLRKNSRTFGRVYQCELDSIQKKMLFVPEGFAHGFAALEDTVFFYKCSNVFHKQSESGILWNDPHLNIKWPVANPVVSAKDMLLPTLEELNRGPSRLF